MPTRTWKFFAQSLTLDEILDTPLRELPSALAAIRTFDDGQSVEVQIGPWTLGIEGTIDAQATWSTPPDWLAGWLRERFSISAGLTAEFNS